MSHPADDEPSDWHVSPWNEDPPPAPVQPPVSQPGRTVVWALIGRICLCLGMSGLALGALHVMGAAAAQPALLLFLAVALYAVTGANILPSLLRSYTDRDAVHVVYRSRNRWLVGDTAVALYLMLAGGLCLNCLSPATIGYGMVSDDFMSYFAGLATAEFGVWVFTMIAHRLQLQMTPEPPPEPLTDEAIDQIGWDTASGSGSWDEVKKKKPGPHDRPPR
ncbi:MAG: hypothetical protein ACREJ2_02850 [Planctomycetota bacterium]